MNEETTTLERLASYTEVAAVQIAQWLREGITEDALQELDYLGSCAKYARTGKLDTYDSRVTELFSDCRFPS